MVHDDQRSISASDLQRGVRSHFLRHLFSVFSRGLWRRHLLLLDFARRLGHWFHTIFVDLETRSPEHFRRFAHVVEIDGLELRGRRRRDTSAASARAVAHACLAIYVYRYSTDRTRFPENRLLRTLSLRVG